MKTVLIIDDTESSRELLGRFLRKHGYSVLFASDGLQGLESVGRQRPDLILLDMMMPVMDGIEFLRHLRCDGDGGGIPVIAVSACSDPTIMERAMKLGVFEYLVKSRFSIMSLLDRIRAALPGSIPAPGQGGSGSFASPSP